ncbi:MAG TPA: hypothetical protein VKX17_03220 [Planctomycetota bacterium]|nr:hypothetical protein [Planctomycetota bacterium]
MESNAYFSWSISKERQRHEWMRLRRSIVSIRLAFLVGGHLAYFAFCGVAHALGRFEQYGHSLWVGFWSMALIGIALLLLEMLYARMCPQTLPRFVIRKTGVTQYGDDGPSAHFDWARARVLQIENDRERPEFRSLVLSAPRKSRWLRRAGRVEIPLPSPDDPAAGVDEVHVVEALRHAIEECGLTWRPCADGAVVLTKAA